MLFICLDIYLEWVSNMFVTYLLGIIGQILLIDVNHMNWQ